MLLFDEEVVDEGKYELLCLRLFTGPPVESM